MMMASIEDEDDASLRDVVVLHSLRHRTNAEICPWSQHTKTCRSQYQQPLPLVAAKPPANPPKLAIRRTSEQERRAIVNLNRRRIRSLLRAADAEQNNRDDRYLSVKSSMEDFIPALPLRHKRLKTETSRPSVEQKPKVIMSQHTHIKLHPLDLDLVVQPVKLSREWPNSEVRRAEEQQERTINSSSIEGYFHRTFLKQRYVQEGSRRKRSTRLSTDAIREYQRSKLRNSNMCVTGMKFRIKPTIPADLQIFGFSAQS